MGLVGPPQWDNYPPPEDPWIYRNSFSKTAGEVGCPDKGCKGQVTNCTNLQIHFVHRNVRETIVITEEGTPPQPRCTVCGMLVPWEVINRLHPTTDIYEREEDQKRWWISEEEDRSGAETAFGAYGHTLETVISFREIGRIHTTTDDDWTELIGNLQKVCQIWAHMLRVLGWEGEDERTLGCFYLAIIKSILIFGLEIWVATPRIGRVLGGVPPLVDKMDCS